eukprot:s521_g8.t1
MVKFLGFATAPGASPARRHPAAPFSPFSRCGGLSKGASDTGSAAFNKGGRCIKRHREGLGKNSVVVPQTSEVSTAALATANEAPFPDYDCRHLDHSGPNGRLLDWAAWRTDLQTAQSWLATSHGVLAKLSPEHRDRAMEEKTVPIPLNPLFGHSMESRPDVRGEKDHLVGSVRIYQALHSDVWERQTHHEDPHLSCFFESQILDWPRFKRIFEKDDWYQPAVDVAYGPQLEEFWREAALECPLGFAMANLIKESICFRAHEQMLGAVLEEVRLPDVAQSGWPILRLLGHVARVDCLPKLTLAAERSAARWNGLRLVYATMAYGTRFSLYLSRFLSRAVALSLDVVAFCLDAAAYEACRVVDGHCVYFAIGATAPESWPMRNFDVFWLDLDVFLFQSPTVAVAQHLRSQPTAELLVSGSFAVDCICSGVVLFRSTPKVKEWLKKLLIWMYSHPYEHDQKLFSAFLRFGERVAFDQELPVTKDEMPTWHFLDPETQFVSARHVDAAGWTGDPDQIVAFHMLQRGEFSEKPG